LGFSSLKCIENLKPFCLVLKIFKNWLVVFEK
jgi:hypothetical protein